MPRKTAAIVITTYNRCDDLRHTCQQLSRLDPPPEEVIVCVDGCTDDSRQMLEDEFPTYHVIENATRQGSIPSRDRAFRLVTSDLIVTLDDDSYPLDSAFLEKISRLAEQHPEAAAFTFPEIRDNGGPADPGVSVESPGHYVRDFPNCAGVILRSSYGTAAAYQPFFSHAYAEPDFCLQLYSAGYTVWFEPSLPVRHHLSPQQRNMLRRHLLNARNELWSVLMRCPFPQILVIAPLRVLRQFLFALGQGWGWWRHEPGWWWDAVGGVRQCMARRRPVPWHTYWAWLRLARRPAYVVQELEARFKIFYPRPTKKSDESPQVTVMITTRNRCADLKRTLRFLTNMKNGPDQILVTADGCTDDTAQVVRSDFPVIQLFLNSHCEGSVVSRDRMLRATKNALVVSLDDDSHPLDDEFFLRIPGLFKKHLEAAVITFPELRDDGDFVPQSRTPQTTGHYVSAYPNCAAAMRRDVYCETGGYPTFFEHAYEETDFALQCYSLGYAVWFEPTLIIRHHLSAKNRSPFRTHHLNARNELWSVWMRCPWPWLPIVSIYRVWRQFRYACTEGIDWAVQEPRWWLSALKGLPRCLRNRRAIRWSIYYSWMRLARHPRFAPHAFGPAERQRVLMNQPNA